MKDLQYENRKWFASKLAGAPRGTKSDVAKALGTRPDVVTRIINFSGKGEARNIHLDELHKLAQYFNDKPPGLVGGHEAPRPPEKPVREITRVPVIGRVSAGKLKEPLSQLQERDFKWLSLSGLGSGDFIGFHLDHDADSIDRVAPPGSILVVDRSETQPAPGKFYVFSIEGQLTTKQWQPGPPPYLSPFSWNPIHKPQFIKRKRDLEVIGRVRRAVVDL